MRPFSITEEMLVTDPFAPGVATLKAPMTLRYARNVGRGAWDGPPHEKERALRIDLLAEKIVVEGPLHPSMLENLETLRIGRALADRAARAQDRRVVALGAPLFTVVPVRETDETRRSTTTGDNPAQPLPLCGTVVRVDVESAEEGVQVLDRIRVWLPVLLALTANSPFWNGRLSRMSSHRYFSRSKWPAPGPSDVYGSEEEYERRMCLLAHPAAARLAASTHLDARLSDSRAMVEVLLADVCMNAEHAAAVGSLIRALVEVTARQWQEGEPPVDATVAGLRASSWLAAVNGLEGQLISPSMGRKRAAEGVVDELVQLLRPVLREQSEADPVEKLVQVMLRDGNGARRQRRIYAEQRSRQAVLNDAVRATHDPSHDSGIPGPILAEAWEVDTLAPVTGKSDSPAISVSNG